MASPEYEPPRYNSWFDRDQNKEIPELLTDIIDAARGIGYELDISGFHEPNTSVLEISVSAKHFCKPDPDYNPQLPDTLFGIPLFDTVTLQYVFDAGYYRPALEIRLEKDRDSIATIARSEHEGPDAPFRYKAVVNDRTYSHIIAAGEVSNLLDQIIQPPSAQNIKTVAQMSNIPESTLPTSDLQHPGRAWALSANAVQHHNAQSTYIHSHTFTPSQQDTDVTIGIEIDTIEAGETGIRIELVTLNDLGVDDAGELYERRESIVGRFDFGPQAQNLDTRLATRINNQETPAMNNPQAVRLFHRYITRLHSALLIKDENL